MDDHADSGANPEFDGGDGEADGAHERDGRGLRGGEGSPSESRAWVHPSEFRRFADLDAPASPAVLSPADQARRGAIAMAAMGFLLAGLLLLTGGNRPQAVQTAQLNFTPHPSLLAHFATVHERRGSTGARLMSFFANEERDSPFKVGDVIVGCDHAPISSAVALTKCLRRHCIDERIDFEVLRQSEIRHVKVKLESGP